MINKRMAAVAASVLLMAAGSALASGTTTVDVTATVSNVCLFKATSMTAIGLGTIDPSNVLSTGVTGTTDITYKCTNGTTPTVTISSGGTTLTETTDSTKKITYAFTLGTPSAGTGFSTAGSAKVVGTATILQAAAQDAQAGSYKDTVTLSINY